MKRYGYNPSSETGFVCPICGSESVTVSSLSHDLWEYYCASCSNVRSKACTWCMRDEPCNCDDVCQCTKAGCGKCES